MHPQALGGVSPTTIIKHNFILNANPNANANPTSAHMKHPVSQLWPYILGSLLLLSAVFTLIGTGAYHRFRLQRLELDMQRNFLAIMCALKPNPYIFA